MTLSVSLFQELHEVTKETLCIGNRDSERLLRLRPNQANCGTPSLVPQGQRLWEVPEDGVPGARSGRRMTKKNESLGINRAGFVEEGRVEAEMQTETLLESQYKFRVQVYLGKGAD